MPPNILIILKTKKPLENFVIFLNSNFRYLICYAVYGNFNIKHMVLLELKTHFRLQNIALADFIRFKIKLQIFLFDDFSHMKFDGKLLLIQKLIKENRFKIAPTHSFDFVYFFFTFSINSLSICFVLFLLRLFNRFDYVFIIRKKN